MELSHNLDNFVKVFGSHDAALALAMSMIEAMTEHNCHMIDDMSDKEREEYPMPDVNDVREQALDYAADALDEFKTLVLQEIRAAKFNPNFQFETKLKSNLQFE